MTLNVNQAEYSEKVSCNHHWEVTEVIGSDPAAAGIVKNHHQVESSEQYGSHIQATVREHSKPTACNLCASRSGPTGL